tara:strand:+ start:135 stop:563 length:429 start_codon:yes stop_codon:yes gene_type:complete
MFRNKTRVAPEKPEEYVLYLPKKYRISACVQGLPIRLNDILENTPDVYENLLYKLKKDFHNDKEMIFVDLYKNNIVLFECLKIIPLMKEQCLKRSLNVVFKKIIISDIEEITTSNDDKLYKPCYDFEIYDDYPAVYVFDNPI